MGSFFAPTCEYLIGMMMVVVMLVMAVTLLVIMVMVMMLVVAVTFFVIMVMVMMLVVTAALFIIMVMMVMLMMAVALFVIMVMVVMLVMAVTLLFFLGVVFFHPCQHFFRKRLSLLHCCFYLHSADVIPGSGDDNSFWIVFPKKSNCGL